MGTIIAAHAIVGVSVVLAIAFVIFLNGHHHGCRFVDAVGAAIILILGLAAVNGVIHGIAWAVRVVSAYWGSGA